jgi:para-nitrobenzyl esterase
MRYFALLALFALAACDNSPQLVVNGELLTGKRVDEGAVFLGVPFAEPPLGDLRWRAPQPLKPRLAERDATAFAPACMQTMRILDWYRSLAEKFGGPADYYDDLEVSEDCLYLNVWTPTLNTDAQLPVMVWVHGGSNKSGWSYEPNYRGDVLAPQGVVVVTVAYRLGAFGFLSHPDLDGADAVANFGLYDLVAALQWIRDNIQKFGGDPERVTMFGESAGAENILALMFAEDARGLFQRGILESTGSYGLSMPSLDNEKQRGERLGELLGAGSLRDLRSVASDELLDVYTANFEHHYHSPAIDGQLIGESTWDSIRSGRNTDIAMIIGANADEYRDKKATAEDYLCPSQMVAATRTASGADAWMYYFTRVRQDSGGAEVGAYHGAEYPYVFGTHDSYMTTEKHDLELSALIQRYWINFAATGNPSAEGLRGWPPFRGTDAELLELGDEVRAIPAVEPGLCGAFQERYLQ